jgi:hypothetical protein
MAQPTWNPISSLTNGNLSFRPLKERKIDMKKTITYFINTRNGEKFATVRKAADEQGNDLGKVILIREDGSDKTVAMSTFKRYFKKIVEEIEVEEPKAEEMIPHARY